MLGAAHRDQRENPTDSQTVADRIRVVAAIGDDAIRSTPRSSAFALEWRNVIHQRQGFLRIIAVRACQPDGEWDALSVTDQMAFAPVLCAVSWIRTDLASTTHRAHGATVNDGS